MTREYIWTSQEWKEIQPVPRKDTEARWYFDHYCDFEFLTGGRVHRRDSNGRFLKL
jgi:hypothetical protein